MEQDLGPERKLMAPNGLRAIRLETSSDPGKHDPGRFLWLKKYFKALNCVLVVLTWS